jgi:hypothetical protein
MTLTCSCSPKGLLGKTSPAVLGGYEQAAKDLDQKLGDDHNLVVMRNTILGAPDNFMATNLANGADGSNEVGARCGER